MATMLCATFVVAASAHEPTGDKAVVLSQPQQHTIHLSEVTATARLPGGFITASTNCYDGTVYNMIEQVPLLRRNAGQPAIVLRR
jgi:hypothetical protein